MYSQPTFTTIHSWAMPSSVLALEPSRSFVQLGSREGRASLGPCEVSACLGDDLACPAASLP